MGWFDRFKRSHTHSAASRLSMGMVLLTSAKQPSVAMLRAAMHELFLDSPVLGGGSDALEGTAFQSQTQVQVRQTVSFNWPGGILALGLVAPSIPEADRRWPVSTAYRWPEVQALIPMLRADAIVTGLSESAGKFEATCRPLQLGS